MTIIELNKEIDKLREERDRVIQREKVLTDCIIALAGKREELKREISGETLFNDMFGG